MEEFCKSSEDGHRHKTMKVWPIS